MIVGLLPRSFRPRRHLWQGLPTPRRAMHLLGIAITHAAAQAVTILIIDRQITVVERATGEVLFHRTVNPNRTRWRTNNGSPADGRTPA
jgi:hypothetical protein